MSCVKFGKVTKIRKLKRDNDIGMELSALQ